MWVFCASAHATPEILRCPANLIFDMENELCSARFDVYGCVGDVATTTTSPEQQDQTSTTTEKVS